ncbi:nicotinamide-nucleotide amidohydrolase family protein [Aliivibrio finisterrensis]|uniref:Nicotinamide-nucleotide amidohydrolase family protein n=1 Tax=Aliivibrio finisterrensis TaxID=511998 RepID=A0A4Q5KKB4_9GAMM|nr:MULTISPECIES: nicotinamide-nucleotide amidohydrolase family protein [Aliivibrio]MDD9175378.1 nicotinamide-nucleotide amidohydrolase family protein [Aliivibrio sp. S3TY1]MDD9192457.1 nicotinamide-nucleotide amidohydrolase family protein [Aliivibrio sp. S2TY2]RYU46730.1 nicotinamide-nucleotide amidohydrolase family protein [Aliivibrio finisterrensis]
MDMVKNTQLAQKVGELLMQQGKTMACAESCTGGGVAFCATENAGSSAWFERGFVTYSNESKNESLGVSLETLQRFGAVSEPVVKEMAKGTLVHSNADITVSISGIAGPGGGSDEKPVGTVCFGFADKHDWHYETTVYFTGDRCDIRKSAIKYAFLTLKNRLLDLN